MKDRRTILQESRLYVVLDSAVADLNKLFEVMKETVEAGTTIVQLRSKEGAADQILDFSKRAVKFLSGRALFIVNDHLDLALASGADGVHLGQEDGDVAIARQILGRDRLIGVSCQTLSQLDRAQTQGADYIGFGSVFKTKTKPDRQPMDLSLIKNVSHESHVPVFFIGGIDLGNVTGILQNDGKRVAVTRAICEAKNVVKTTKEFLTTLMARS